MINEIKKRREMMRRRKNSLFKKANELGKLCDANVAVIVYKEWLFLCLNLEISEEDFL